MKDINIQQQQKKLLNNSVHCLCHLIWKSCIISLTLFWDILCVEPIFIYFFFGRNMFTDVCDWITRNRQGKYVVSYHNLKRNNFFTTDLTRLITPLLHTDLIIRHIKNLKLALSVVRSWKCHLSSTLNSLFSFLSARGCNRAVRWLWFSNNFWIN